MVSTQTQRKTQTVTAREGLDFSGQNLRGRNFKGQDLAGADFSGADIRGARFTNANLAGARFVEAKAGLQKRWLITQTITASVFVGLSTYSLSTINAVFIYEILDKNILMIGWIGMIFITLSEIFCLYIIGKKGLNLRSVSEVISVCVIASILLEATLMPVPAITIAAGAGAITGAVISAALASILIGMLASLSGHWAAIGVGICAITGITWSWYFENLALQVTTYTLLIAPPLVLAQHISLKIDQIDEKFAFARNLGLKLVSVASTTFSGADLTHANFSQAKLKSSNFNRSRQRKTILKYTCWDNTKQLNKAQLNQSILADPRVPKLLSNRTVYEQDLKSTKRTKIDFTKADLHEADLNGICFRKADLIRADLTHATCRNADLTHANLTELQAIGTDFTNADLTGACIENWNIDETTILDGVKCDYIFLKQHPDPKTGSRERRPHDPNKTFQPGDFEKLYKQVMTTVELLFRNGIHPASFAQAFQQLTEQYPDATLNKLERKGADILVTLEVPKDADKGQIEHNFDKTYNAQLEAAREQGRLEGRNEALEQGNQTLQKLLAQAIEAKPAITVNQNQNQGENIITGDHNTQLNQTNSGGTNFQTNAEGSSLNQAETITPSEG